jgi:hypothetical protein
MSAPLAKEEVDVGIVSVCTGGGTGGVGLLLLDLLQPHIITTKVILMKRKVFIFGKFYCSTKVIILE